MKRCSAPVPPQTRQLAASPVGAGMACAATPTGKSVSECCMRCELHWTLQAVLDKYGRLACSLPRVSLTDALPSKTSEMIYLFDDEDRTLGARKWRKKVQIRFDVFSPYWFTQPILMPYPVHPVHAGPDLRDRLQTYRASEKKMRVFFSGDREGYAKNRIQYPKPKLPRLEVINAVLTEMGDKALLVRGEQNLDSICAVGYVNRCLIMDQN